MAIFNSLPEDILSLVLLAYPIYIVSELWLLLWIASDRSLRPWDAQADREHDTNTVRAPGDPWWKRHVR